MLMIILMTFIDASATFYWIFDTVISNRNLYDICNTKQRRKQESTTIIDSLKINCGTGTINFRPHVAHLIPLPDVVQLSMYIYQPLFTTAWRVFIVWATKGTFFLIIWMHMRIVLDLLLYQDDRVIHHNKNVEEYPKCTERI